MPAGYGQSPVLATFACFFLLAPVALSTFGAVPVDLSKYDRRCGVDIRREGELLRAQWQTAEGPRCTIEISLRTNTPLISLVDIGGKVLARNIMPRYPITTGTRFQKPGVKYIFFDKPITEKNGPVKHFDSVFEMQKVRVESSGARATVSFSRISAGPFSGELDLHFYAGSPLLHFDATMSLDEKAVAYVYDALLEGKFERIVWKDVSDQFVRRPPEGAMQPVAVRNRTIMAESDAGTLAVFPAPHAFFFPRDYTVNFKFAQFGAGAFGLRQDAAGGPGHQGAFIPWFDAPEGKTQHMSFFVQLSRGPAETALEEVKRYTRGDTFKPIDGYITLATHMHAKLTVSEQSAQPRAAEFKRLFKNMKVQAFQLAEFHGDGHPQDPGELRLRELKAMFDLCRKYSDDQFLMLPSEEANAYFPGHSVLLFPRPVYLTLVPIAGAPGSEMREPYGKVYHPQNTTDLADLVRQEKGLAWTSHPRIKGSEGCPDRFREEPWYKDDLWLGGTWKAMPGDLSEPRLGVRSLDLLDDMNLWGQKKFVVGEVDCFDVDDTHEIYGHMNINYLRMAKLPTIDDWSPILDVLRRGDFFVSTGEVLLHSCQATGDKLRADVEWTLPLSHAEIVVCDGKATRRKTISLPETKAFGRQTFEWPIELKGAEWYRVEVWDVALDGAFTQPIKVK